MSPTYHLCLGRPGKPYFCYTCFFVFFSESLSTSDDFERELDAMLANVKSGSNLLLGMLFIEICNINVL